MFGNKNKSRYGRHIYRLNKIRAPAVVLLVLLAAVGTITILSRGRTGGTNIRRELLRVWNEGDFEQAFELSKGALTDKPLDYFLLTINGFSAYQTGISQINNHNTLYYIDESIQSLRKAILLKESYKDGRVYYVLGKAYSYKGNEYADLAIKYLEVASNLNYEAEDIPEFLGLAFASIGDYRKSVEAFSRAFKEERSASDNLLLSIGRSYMAMQEFGMAIGYFQRCVDTSPDSRSIVVARLLLAQAYIQSGDHDSAEKQYLSILSESGENAEVRFQLGELFHLRGDTTRARAEWRIAYRQDPAHARARARLNI